MATCNCSDCRTKRTAKESAMTRRRAATLARIELDARAGHTLNHTLASAATQYVAGASI
jgi:hypothetical protein